ncbi:MAG: hypothetical protein K2J67_08840 [Lachnospiraceae bacterium]|nr:hypothetical protein [Lachnospiraceae bacterium]
MDTDYGPDRRFFRSLSMAKGYDGYLIGKLFCRRLAASNVHSMTAQPEALGEVRVRKQKKNYVILELPGENYLLTLTLVCPSDFSGHAEPGKMKVRVQNTENIMFQPEDVIGRHTFTPAEILDFVQSVQDTNGIHRTAEPIVPGLLMAEWFFSILHPSDWEAVELRFHMPAYAGQHLCLCRQSEGYDCLSEETGQLFWSGKLTMQGG